MTPTKKLPLFIITGASCAGKSTLCEVLFQKESGYHVMESDLLWSDRYNTPEDNYREYRRLWMNLCANISQIGMPVVLCGCAVPEQFEALPERELFTSVHYLAVVCGDETLRSRAVSGRGVTDQTWIDSSLSFNRWLIENASVSEPPIRLLDTSSLSPQEAAVIADGWIRDCLACMQT